MSVVVVIEASIIALMSLAFVSSMASVVLDARSAGRARAIISQTPDTALFRLSRTALVRDLTDSETAEASTIIMAMLDPLPHSDASRIAARIFHGTRGDRRRHLEVLMDAAALPKDLAVT